MKIVHVFLDADLRNGHDGFDAVLKKQDIKISDLDAGEAVLFLNTAKTKAKAYGPHGYLGYVRFGGKVRLADLDIFTEAAVPGETTTLGRNAASVLRGAIGVALKAVLEDRPRVLA